MKFCFPPHGSSQCQVLIHGILGMWKSAQQDSPLDILTGNLGLIHPRGVVPFASAHTLPRTPVVGIGENETALPRGCGAG